MEKNALATLFFASLTGWKFPWGNLFLQLDLNLERLRVAVDDLLVKLSRMFRQQKQQTIFLINNYDLVLSVLKVDRYTCS